MKKLILLGLMALAMNTLLVAQEIVPNEVLIKITPTTDINDVVDKANDAYSFNAQIKVKKTLSEGMNIYLLSHSEELTEDELVDKLYFFSGVLAAQKNHKVQLRETVPNDAEYGTQWHHQNIQSELAWDITTGGLTGLGDEIVVCVIEGGNLQHVDLQDNAWTNTLEIPDNGIDDDDNGYVDDVDGWNVQSDSDAGVFDGGHGTNVMGMIGAKGDNDLGVAGANWNVKIMSVAGENIGSEASLVEAYDYPYNMRNLYEETSGAKGAFVVATNASWGIDGGQPDNSPIWCGIYQTLGEGGILNCGATSNQNVDIDAVGDLPTACASDYMISVTATNVDDVRTFSGYGQTTVDLGAPGDQIYTTSGNNGYTFTSGTSFASPMTAGVIGLLYSVPCPGLAELAHNDPQGAADLVKQALYDGVDLIDNLTTETVTGGRVNSFTSLNLLLAACDPDACYAPFSSEQITEDNVSFTINWTAFNPDNTYGFRYRAIGAEDWIEALELTEPTFELNNLIWCGEYEYQLKTICSGDSETEWTASTIIVTDGCCVSPPAELLSANPIDESSSEISWSTILAANSYNLTYSALGGLSTTIENIEGTSIVLDNLEPCTEYDVMVTSACTDGNSPEENLIYFTTLGCGHCTDSEFCQTVTETTEDEWIQTFSIADYTNDSGDDGGYGDYTGSDITLTRGNTFTASVTPGYDGNTYNESIVVWVDYNQDGDFTDAERVLETPSTQETITSAFTVPLDTPLGLTRIRVSLIWADNVPNNEFQDPCGEYEYGETEDYCVTIDEFDSVSELAKANSFAMFPNPANESVTISVTTIQPNMTVRILDALGRVVTSENLTNPNQVIPIQNYNAGTYFIEITSENGVVERKQLIKL